MITSSIVIYKTDIIELKTVLGCVLRSAMNRIFLIDNSPTDELRYFSDFSTKIEYIYGQGNIGYGAAHNIAIRKSVEFGAKYHVVINPDIQFSNGMIENLANYMDRNLDVGQVMPKVIYPNGELQYLCKLLPTPMDLIGRRFIPFKSYIEKTNYRFEMRASGYDKTMEVPFLSGCFMFFRTEALDKVKGFSDQYWMYCEDLDLCRKVYTVGYKTMYYPEVTIIHAHKKESFKNKKMLMEHIKSAIKYFNKWGWFFDVERTRINKKLLKKIETDL